MENVYVIRHPQKLRAGRFFLAEENWVKSSWRRWHSGRNGGESYSQQMTQRGKCKETLRTIASVAVVMKLRVGKMQSKSRRLYYLVNILRLALQNVQAAWPVTGPQAQNYGLRCSTSQQLDGF